jgi:riboflavin kinase / FMN adenylyltransferase
MQIFHSLEDAALRGAALAIGSFDGLHRGHRQLLERMIQAAGEDGAAPAVLTFFPHPRAVLGAPDAPAFHYLLPLEERLELLRGFPLEAVIVQPFDTPFSRTPAAAFLQTLKRRLGLRSLWCGPNFSVGYRREGNVAFLSENSLALGYSLYVVPPLTDAEGPVSSSRIRAALAAGDTAQAAALLGRPFGLTGTVVHGMGRGRKLGMPTANLDLWPELTVPAYGVYATRTVCAGGAYPSVTSIGVRPTFENGSAHPATVETHLLDFDGDLYGARLRVEFAQRLRDEERFPDVEALRIQMVKDVDRARQLLRGAA